jgi:TetR/AcrR family transcriptional regulator, fatty acid metabolism regulator protein
MKSEPLKGGVKRGSGQADRPMPSGAKVDRSSRALASAMLPKRRKKFRAQEMLKAAREVFSEFGFDAASISEISRRADCVEGTIYTYYENKRALLDAVLASYYDELIADIAPRLAAIQSTEDRLSFLVARHLQIPLDDPGVSRLIMTQVRTLGEYFGSPLHGLNKRYCRFIADTLEEGRSRGELRAEFDVALVRDLIFGGIEHWTWNAMARRRQYDPAKVARQILATLLPGLKIQPTLVADHALERISQRLDRLENTLLPNVAEGQSSF